MSVGRQAHVKPSRTVGVLAELDDVLDALADEVQPALEVRAVEERFAHPDEKLADLRLRALRASAPPTFESVGTSRHPSTTIP
jgi:predicted metal-dependent enzyme (double-stranded beta helix superfamily)